MWFADTSSISSLQRFIFSPLSPNDVPEVVLQTKTKQQQKVWIQNLQKPAWKKIKSQTKNLFPQDNNLVSQNKRYQLSGLRGLRNDMTWF